MPGTQYIALSGLRARIDELDRLAGDLANVGTAGYKAERAAHAVAERAKFDHALETAIDTTVGTRRLDMTEGLVVPTGRDLDVAIEGPGFFVLSTPAGERYTRDGHFKLNGERQLVAPDGSPVMGEKGPITLGDGDVRIDQDGTVWAGSTAAGRLAVVDFADASRLEREQGARLRAAGQPATPVERVTVFGSALEQSNVAVADRLAQLTTLSRSFEALQRSISLVMNDVDGRAIEAFGRR
jgi:flagellar basal body rod protein FlgG